MHTCTAVLEFNCVRTMSSLYHAASYITAYNLLWLLLGLC
jgi:hypothetical protein